MRRLLLSILLVMCFVPQVVHGQSDGQTVVDPVLIFFRGQLLDKLTGEPVQFATVINGRTRGGTTTDQNGLFSMEMLNIDTIMISVIGYNKEELVVDLPYYQDSTQVFLLEALRYPIDEVVVKGEKREYGFDNLGTGKVSDLSPEFRATTFEKKPKWWNALIKPYAFIEYHQKGEKKRRELRSAVASEKDWQRLSKYYNSDMVYELTGLEGDEADLFMMFFNANNTLTGNASEYDVRKAILVEYGEYLKLKSKAKQEE